VERTGSGEAALAKKLRHEDPRQGREHFDLLAGIEWECGPDPNDITNSIPDVPWNRSKGGSTVIHSKGKWAVTDYGLEPLIRPPTHYERHQEWLEQATAHWTSLNTPSKKPPPPGDDTFKIPAYELLAELREVNGPRRYYKLPIVVAMERWVDIDGFDAFEDCFYAALPVHCRSPLPVARTFEEAIRMHLHEQWHGKRTLQDQPCSADPDLLKETFRIARDIVLERTSEAQ
jgi:hypothetical protein